MGAAEAGQSHVVNPTLILRRSKLFRDYLQAFESTTGLTLVLRAPGSFAVPLAGSKHINPFCALMTRANKTCTACLQFQQRAEESMAMQSITLQCHAGLSESVVPVRVGHHVLGSLQTGQVFLSSPSARRIKGIGRAPAGPSAGVVNRELESAYLKTPVVKPDQYRAIIQLLVIFAEHLAAANNQLLMSRSTLESPWGIENRAFITKHQVEIIGLEDVARAAKMSPCYFCKPFKKGGGAYLHRIFSPHARRIGENSSSKTFMFESVKRHLQPASNPFSSSIVYSAASPERRRRPIESD